MGGSSPQPQSTQTALDPQMLTLIKSMQDQQLQAQQQAMKQEQAAIRNSQVQAAQQAGSVGNQQAQQQLGLQNQYQEALDASAKQNAMGVGGYAATGGAFDPNAARVAQLSNLGAAAGSLPTSVYNQAGSGVAPKNPAMTAAAPVNTGVSGASQFNLPSTQGLKFGGI